MDRGTPVFSSGEEANFLKTEMALVFIHFSQFYQILGICEAGNSFQGQEDMDLTERKVQIL